MSLLLFEYLLSQSLLVDLYCRIFTKILHDRQYSLTNEDVRTQKS